MDLKVFFHVSKLETLGDRMVRPTARKIARRPYREFEYMPELQNKNPLIVMFKKFGNTINKIIELIRPKAPKHFDNDAQNVKGTTIEI